MTLVSIGSLGVEQKLGWIVSWGNNGIKYRQPNIRSLIGKGKCQIKQQLGVSLDNRKHYKFFSKRMNDTVWEYMG